MKRVNFLAAAAALTMWSLAPAHAAPKSKAESPATGAEATLEQIDVWSAAVSDAAFKLNDMAIRQLDPGGQMEYLDILRVDINKIGSDLKALEAERDSLAPWETKALDQILPLMQDAASNTEKATEIYNSDRQHLWTTAYVGDTERVSQDTEKVATLLHDYLKLEKMQEKELPIAQNLGE